MGQYRPGSNGQVIRSANLSSVMSPRPQPNVRDETSEYEETQRELRPAYTAEYRTMYSPSASTPGTDQCPENKWIGSRQVQDAYEKIFEVTSGTKGSL